MLDTQIADIIFTNGHVITMDEKGDSPSTVIVKDGIIVGVGSTKLVEKWLGKSTKLVDLNGQTIMPGFIETHIHPAIYGQNMIEIDCRETSVSNVNDFLEKVHEKTKELPKGVWIRGYGWNESQIDEGRPPTRQELDEVSPDHPVFLKRTCNHIAVVNSQAFELNNIDDKTPNPSGGSLLKDDNGKLNGVIQEQALSLISIPDYTLEEMTEGFKIGQENLLQWGFTTVHEMSASTKEMTMYQKLIEEDNLKVRIRPWLLANDMVGMKGILDSILTVGLRSNYGNDKLRFQGAKYMLDGAGSGGTAHVLEPNESDGQNGISYYTLEEYVPYIEKTLKAGLRVAVHAIGDAAIELAIKGFESVHESIDITNMRNRIEHCGLPTNNHLKRMKELELIAANSIGFLYYVGENYLYHYGEERMGRLYPQKSFLEYNIVAPANSDLPVVSADPFKSIYSMVTRKTNQGTILGPNQKVTIMDALKAYTNFAAYSSFEEEELGIIKTGAKADLIILSDNPLEVEEENLKDLYVKQTYIEGELVYG